VNARRRGGRLLAMAIVASTATRGLAEGPPTTTRDAGSIVESASGNLADATSKASVGELLQLDPATRVALDATPDGRDLRDEAWHRLVAEARRWPRDLHSFTQVAVTRPRWSEIVAEPDRFRGMLLEVRGRLEQATPVRTPGIEEGGVLEWFVRTGVDRDSTAGDAVVQVFVPAEAVADVRVGRTVAVVGRLLRRTDLEGRDGTVRRFATIVGVPLVGAASVSTWSPGWVVALATLVLLPVALFLRRIARRARMRRPHVDSIEAERDAIPHRDDLPSDPADALDVLAAERTGADR